MDRRFMRPAMALIGVCLISLFMVTRTPGFENIRVVQFLLIFLSGMCGGVAIGLIRVARRGGAGQA